MDVNSAYGIIYVVTNLINGKRYVGQTIKGLDERKRQHLKDAKIAYHNAPLYKAMRKYGTDAFSWEIQDYAFSREELNQKEIFYIQKYDSLCHGNGYNCASGGSNGNNFASKTSEERQEINERLSLKSCQQWERYSPEQKQQVLNALHTATKVWWATASEEVKLRRNLALSEALTGRKFTPEQCNKISEAKKGIPWPIQRIIDIAKDKVYPNMSDDQFVRGTGTMKPHIIKQIKKSKSKMGDNNPMKGVLGECNPLSKWIRCTDLRTGMTQDICGIQEASRQLRIPATYICRVAKHGYGRHSVYGYSFVYI